MITSFNYEYRQIEFDIVFKYAKTLSLKIEMCIPQGKNFDPHSG